jgi:hypothetical protein
MGAVMPERRNPILRAVGSFVPRDCAFAVPAAVMVALRTRKGSASPSASVLSRRSTPARAGPALTDADRRGRVAQSGTASTTLWCVPVGRTRRIPEAGCREQCRERVSRALDTAGHGQHEQVHQLAVVRRGALRQHRLPSPEVETPITPRPQDSGPEGPKAKSGENSRRCG